MEMTSAALPAAKPAGDSSRGAQVRTPYTRRAVTGVVAHCHTQPQLLPPPGSNENIQHLELHSKFYQYVPSRSLI